MNSFFRFKIIKFKGKVKSIFSIWTWTATLLFKPFSLLAFCTCFILSEIHSSSITFFTISSSWVTSSTWHGSSWHYALGRSSSMAFRASSSKGNNWNLKSMRINPSILSSSCPVISTCKGNICIASLTSQCMPLLPRRRYSTRRVIRLHVRLHIGWHIGIGVVWIGRIVHAITFFIS